MNEGKQDAQPDVIVAHSGSLFLFTPATDAARAWLHENVQADAQWLGDSLVVEHRFAVDLARGLGREGFVVA